MDYTPRQATAFLIICQARRREEMRDQIVAGLLAARGEEKAVRAQLKDLDNA